MLSLTCAGRRLVFLLLMLSLVVPALSCSKKEGGTSAERAEVDGPAPQFVLDDLKGSKVRLEDFKGRVVMLEFFTTWCAPCQLSAPELQTLYERYRDRGFTVLGITLEGNQPEALGAFIKKHRLTYPVLIDDGNASKRYEVFSIPTSFIIDKQGKVRKKHMGYNPGLADDLSKEVEALL